jgi:hypothetical protein
MLDQARVDASLTEDSERISAVCGRLSPRVKKIADVLELALVPRPEEA